VQDSPGIAARAAKAARRIQFIVELFISFSSLCVGRSQASSLKYAPLVKTEYHGFALFVFPIDGPRFARRLVVALTNRRIV
jgi:hypothetical protein